MRNSTLRMVTAVSACAVLGAVALGIKISGGHPQPAPTYTLNGQPQGGGGLSVVTPTPTAAAVAQPKLRSTCHYDAAATNASPPEYNLTLYKLTVTNPSGQHVRVREVQVNIYQSATGALVGTDTPWVDPSEPQIPGWRPVTIGPGATISRVLAMHQELNFSGAWSCALASWSS